MVPIFVPDKVDDLLGLLLRAYNDFVKEQLTGEHRTSHPMLTFDAMYPVQEFVNWSRTYLAKHPIVGTYPVANGLGVRFADNSGVPFAEQPKERRVVDDCIHITNPSMSPQESTWSPHMAVTKGE